MGPKKSILKVNKLNYNFSSRKFTFNMGRTADKGFENKNGPVPASISKKVLKDTNMVMLNKVL